MKLNGYWGDSFFLTSLFLLFCFLDWKNMRVNKWYSQHSLKWKFTLEIITDIAIVPLSSAFPLFIILNEYTNCQIHYCGLQPKSLQYNFSYSNKDIVVLRELMFERQWLLVGGQHELKQHASVTNSKQGKHVVTKYETMDPKELRHITGAFPTLVTCHSLDLETSVHWFQE